MRLFFRGVEGALIGHQGRREEADCRMFSLSKGCWREEGREGGDRDGSKN